MHVRLGDLLVERGAITAQQRDEILIAQTRRSTPFGVLAEELHGVSPSVIEDAWVTQYAAMAPRLDPRTCTIEPHIKGVIERRQAWQFGVIPVAQHHEGIELVTTVASLGRALRFVGWRITTPTFFSICSDEALPIALELHYPIAGLDAHFVNSVMSRYAKAG